MIDNLLKKYPNELKVVIKSYPLGFHKQAAKASKYWLAADKQGKGNEMYHMIFCGTTEAVDAKDCVAYRKLKTNEDLPLEYAKTLGLDVEKFKVDANSPSIANRLETEKKQFTSAKFARASVPKFLIQGKVPSGRRSVDLFSSMIDAELKKIKGK